MVKRYEREIAQILICVQHLKMDTTLSRVVWFQMPFIYSYFRGEASFSHGKLLLEKLSIRT